MSIFKLSQKIVEICEELDINPIIARESERRLFDIDNYYFDENPEEAIKEEERLKMHILYMQTVECMSLQEAEKWISTMKANVLSKERGELGGFYYIVEYWNSLVRESLVKQINAWL